MKLKRYGETDRDVLWDDLTEKLKQAENAGDIATCIKVCQQQISILKREGRDYTLITNKLDTYESQNASISAPSKPLDTTEKVPEDKEATSHIKCGYCEALIEDKTTKCPHCHKTICANCGNPIGSGVNKCPKCGQLTSSGQISSLGWGLLSLGVLAVLLVFFFKACGG